MNIEFSIVIPTWNRKERLIDLVKKIIKINTNFDKYEIIICDSNSTDGTENLINSFIKQNFDINIKIHNTKFNNVSQKRNFGIKKSKFNFIILIDDDCLPDDSFFYKYEELCKKYYGKKLIFSGMYLTDKDKIQKSNYYRYRDTRNYKIIKNNYLDYEFIDFWNIVTGNLCFEKKILLENNILFNEEITGYGFEDVDWGYRIAKQNIKIVKVDVGVLHNETSSNIKNYKLKWYYQALTGMPLLIRENLSAASKLPLFFLEKNVNKNSKQKTITFFLSFFMNRYFANLIEYYLIITDKKKIFFYPVLYKLLLVYYYYLGVKNRKKNLISQEDTKKNWFSNGYK